MTENNKPEQKYVAGSISATIWKNEGTKKNGEKFEFQTVNIERSYKDKEDKWQKTNGMRTNDLPKVQLVSQKAYEYLVMKKQDENTEETSE